MGVGSNIDSWRAAFETFRADPAAAMGARARAAAFERFEAHGLPTRRHEYWKYTPVRALAPTDDRAARAATDPFGGVDAYRFVFVDGRLDAERSDRAALAAAIDVADASGASWMDGLFEALQVDPVDGAMRQVERPLADLNLAFFTDGLAARVPAGVTLEKPIHLRYEGEAAAHLRLELRVEAGASATVLESGPGALTTGAEIIVEDGATLHHLRAQTELESPQFTALFARIGAEARFRSFTLSRDGALARNESVLTLAGENGSGHLAGAVLGRGDGVLDNTVYVRHEAAHCESRQVFKHVLDEGARGVFQGKIFVKTGAQKTDGYQISQSVLLDEGAQFNAKPELEIYADDVACSHGSTSGALDADSLYYLRARGVPKVAAEAMLVAAFVDEAIEEIEDEALQERMRAEVADWMAARAA